MEDRNSIFPCYKNLNEIPQNEVQVPRRCKVVQIDLAMESYESIIIPRLGIRNSENKRKQDQPSLSLSNLDPSLHLIDQQKKVGVTSVTNNHSISVPETVYVYIGSQGKQELNIDEKLKYKQLPMVSTEAL